MGLSRHRTWRAVRACCLLASLTALGACPGRRRSGEAPPSAGDRGRPPAKRPPPDVPESGPLAQKILYEQAKGLLRTGKPAEAVQLFKRSIQSMPRGELLASCYLGLGSALGELGRHDEALEAYRKVIELRPSDPEAYRALAAGLEEAGKLGEAREALEQSLALDADQPAVYQDLAAVHVRQKDLEGAKRVYLRYEITRTRLILTLGRNKDEQARVAAATALGDARDEATVKALGLALTDRSRLVRLAVIHSLGQQGLAAGAGPLRELQARSADVEERRAIEISLKAISAAPQPPPASMPAAGSRAPAAPSRRP